MNINVSTNALFSDTDRQDIQGFVTSSFGHLPNAAYLFFRFDHGEAARRWLRELRPEITTARSWRRRADASKEAPKKTLNLAFSASGLRGLGLPDNCLESFPAEFVEGMAAPERSCDLGDTGDSAPSGWQFGNAERPVDGVALLCADSPESLELDRQRFARRLVEAGPVKIVAEEFGTRPRDDKEPFGFQDGMAQPSILGITKNGVRAGEFILGYENEYGYHPVSPLLRCALDPAGLLPDSPNPHHRGERDFGRNGTFLVYRKLEQNVAGFWAFMRDEAKRLHDRMQPGFMVWLAAKMIGRWPGGAPLALSPESDDPALSKADNFLYQQLDPNGLRCPFGAHIRRTNPRDQLRPAGLAESLHMTARHRLLRRGRPYGTPLFDLSVLEHPDSMAARQVLEQLSDDGKKRGLHFLCINASIKSQFEFVQQAWMNNARANGCVDNPDPMASGATTGRCGSMLIPQEALDLRTSQLPSFVTVRAGAYLFLPSLSAISYLSSE